MSRWFRAYSETLNDPKVQQLPLDAFKAWHNALYLASNLDSRDGNIGTLGGIAFAFRQCEEDVAASLKPLADAGMLTKKGNVYIVRNWAKRQRQGESEDAFYVYFVGPKDMSEVKIGHSKNPWARLSNLQTGCSKKLYVIATIKTTESGDRWLSDFFPKLRITGEWFKPDAKMSSLIKALSEKEIKGKESVENYLVNYGRATTDTEQNRTEVPLPKGNGALPDSDKVFWDASKAFLGAKNASLIGKWVRDHGKELTAQAITAAQLDRAADPKEFVIGFLRKRNGSAVPDGPAIC